MRRHIHCPQCSYPIYENEINFEDESASLSDKDKSRIDSLLLEFCAKYGVDPRMVLYSDPSMIIE